ncbi:MAG: GNAT family N-acetyltransferase [Burkholderiaceae bacterium]|nr:GNAT family N-acetyltransferase [Burkholderiaceae bacterium]
MITHDSHPWVAKNGTQVTIRPICSDDFALAQEFVNGLSPSTGYQRLMSLRRPSLEELRRWTDIDPAREHALVATVLTDGHERQIGVARYVRGPKDRDAEFAIVIADEWQRQGLGHELLSCLIHAAQEVELERLVGTTLSDNHAMLKLAGRLGFKRTRVSGHATTTALTMELSPTVPGDSR